MSEPTQLYLIRHGEVETQYHRVFGGLQIDMELSPLGHCQADAMASYLKGTPLNTIYVSPMRRAQLTVAPLACHFPCVPAVMPGLHEVDFGDWTGLTWQQLHDRHQVSAFHWLEMMEQAAIPNGESAATFRARIQPCVEEILQKHPGQKVAVVCHGGVIRMILAILLKLPLPVLGSFDIEYASLTHVVCHSHKNEVRLLNFTPWRDLA